jgi:hypothetical protein
MQVELKRLQVFSRMSQETTAFVADVWIDGKKAGTAENDGHGGSTCMRLFNPTFRQKLLAFGATQVPEKYKAVTPGDEWVVDNLVEQFLAAKESVRIAKKTAKNDTALKATCAKRGSHAVRFTTADQSIHWQEFSGDAATIRPIIEKKYGVVTGWTVLA